MKQKFSKAWKASKQPRKQRKYAANAPLHIKQKKLTVNLSKELRKKVGKRNIVVRKDDKVKIMVGSFKRKTGKVLQVFTKIGKVTIEGIQVKKQDGSKALVKIWASNLQIIEMVDRETRTAKKKEEVSKKQTLKEEVKKEESTKIVKEKKK